MTTQPALLPPAEEDTLHTTRLLTVEDKHIKRLTRRLLDPAGPLYLPPAAPPTPPPDASAVDEAAAANASTLAQQSDARANWHTETLLDLAAFEANIHRVRLLLTSNASERARYAAERQRILEAADTVRNTNTDLHMRLRDAQATLAERQSYDKLAEGITKNPSLKPRQEQSAEIEKLGAEITELGREAEEYAATWRERRAQFGRIVEEGETMLRLIRDEKEEAERLEGMEGEDGGGEAMTPMRGSRGQTPAVEEGSAAGEVRNKALEGVKGQERLGSSRNASPMRKEGGEMETQKTGDDATMAEAEDHNGPEEGEEVESMDTT